MIRWLFTLLAASLPFPLVAVTVLTTGLFGTRIGILSICGRTWARLILLAAGLRLNITGLDHLEAGKSYFFVGNHQSALDIPILLVATRGRVRFLAKESLFNIPLFGRAIRSCGHVPIRRSSARSVLVTLDETLGKFKPESISLAAFPEGTRSVDGRLLPFRRGTMKIGQRTGLAFVPFTIDGSIAVHKRGIRRVRPGQVRLRFMEPVPPDEVASLDPTALQERLRSMISANLSPSNERGEMESNAVATS